MLALCLSNVLRDTRGYSEGILTKCMKQELHLPLSQVKNHLLSSVHWCWHNGSSFSIIKVFSPQILWAFIFAQRAIKGNSTPHKESLLNDWLASKARKSTESKLLLFLASVCPSCMHIFSSIKETVIIGSKKTDLNTAFRTFRLESLDSTVVFFESYVNALQNEYFQIT